VIDEPMTKNRAARLGELLSAEDGALTAAIALEDAVRGLSCRSATQSEP